MTPESAASAKGLAIASQPIPPPYLTPAEVAEILRVSGKSVYRWAAQDPSMPVLRIGSTVRFPRERLLAWLRSREQGQGRPRMPRQVLAPANHAPPKEARGA